jgi:hypothetical protein
LGSPPRLPEPQRAFAAALTASGRSVEVSFESTL